MDIMIFSIVIGDTMKKLYLIICCFALNANAMYTNSVWDNINQEETHTSAPGMGIFTDHPSKIFSNLPRPPEPFVDYSADNTTSYDEESNSTDKDESF